MSRPTAWIAALLIATGVVLVPLPAGAAPVAPVITGHPSATVETPYAAFSFDAPGATSYDCRVFPAGTASGSRPTYDDCGSSGSHLTSALADGTWTFEVRGRDGGGAGPSSARDWTVTSEPVVQWIVEPSGSYDARVVSATFTAGGASGYECRLDAAPFATCGSGRDGYWTSGQLPVGPHALQVRASRNGVLGPIATATFTIAEPLGITWLEEPADVSDGRTVVARFTASGAERYECRLVRTDPLPDPLPDMVGCGQGGRGLWTSDELADGGWRLDVRAVEGAELGPVSSSAFVVAVSGTVEWVSPPPATIDGRVASAVFRAPGVHSYECRAYRTDPVPATLPDFGSCGSSQQGWWTSPVLEDGAWQLDVRPQDARGERPIASTTFTIAPEREVVWTVRPTGTLAGTGYAAAFRSTGARNYECRLDAGPWLACGSGREGHVTGTADPGPHQLDVRGVDPTGPGPEASTTFTLQPVDGASSDTSIVVGADGTITSPWAAFAWTAEDVSCFRWQLDGADDDLSAQGCYSPNGNGTYAVAQAFGSLADGTHTLRVQAQSTGGGYGPVTSRTFTVDTSSTSRPQLTSGPQGTVATPWAAFSWSSADAECFRWELDGADDDLSQQGCYSPSGNGAYASGQGFGPLADGPHVLRVQGQSAGGTFGPVATRSFTVDTSAATRPRFTSGPAQGATVPSAGVALSWTADQVACFRWELDAADDDLSQQGCYSPNGNGAFALVQAFTNLADGQHTVTVQGQSQGGTFGPVTTRTLSVDTSAVTRPRFITGPGEDTSIPTSAAAFSWAADEAECLRWTLDGTAASLANAGCYSPSGNGAYAQAQSFSSLADGVHTLRVQGKSYAGTYGPVTNRTFRVNSGPWVNVSSRPRQALPTGTAAMAWSAPGAACFRWEMDGADDDLSSQGCYDPVGNGAYAQEQAFTGLLDGAHVLRVQAQATGGTFGPVTQVPFTVETKAPETTITAGPTGYVSSTSASLAFVADETATFQCRVDGGSFGACTSPLSLAGLSQGDHLVEVRAIDLAGKTDATPDSRTWTVDTVDPTITDLTGPTDVIVDPNFTAVLSYVADEPATFECRLVPAAFASCGASVSYDDQPDGDYRFEVRAVDRAGNRGAIAFREWTVVTDPPETAITAAPTDVVSATSATVSFSSPDGPVTFECEVDAAAWAACTSPLQLTGLVQGSHTVRVRAVIQGSLRDPSPAVATWTVDTVGPTTTITSGPSGPVGTGPVSFTFTADEPATFTCRLDAGTPYACTSPDGLGDLGSGSHTFRVRATDGAGNQGPEVSRTWDVDAVAPIVTITGQPAALTQQTSATVSFTVDDPTATVECRLDGGAWTGCSSPATRNGLSDGTHVLEVRATDGVGNVSDPASAQWRVDTTPPIVTITTGPTGSITTSSATLGFAVSETADTFCRVDSGTFAACSSPYAFTGLADGVRTLQIRATDTAGNTGPIVQRILTVDTVAPTVTITGGPTGTVAQTSATLTFTVDESPVTTRCSLDGAAFTVCSSPATYTGLDQGPHILRVQATDDAGNTGPIESRGWTVDTPEPETTIDTAPASPSNDTTPAFTFTSDTTGATFECRLDGAAGFTSCSSGIEIGPLPDGSHTMRVRAVAGGLTDPTPALHTWTVDATAPVVTVTQRPTGVTTVAGSRFAFSVSEAGEVECQVDGGSWLTCASPFDPAVSDGDHSVRIRSTDPAGNVGQTPVMSWAVDGTEPDVVITSGPSGNYASRTATYIFTVDDPTAVVECLLDGGAWELCSSPRILTLLEDGPHSFSVRATDPAGNRGAEGRNFFVDATPPVVTFTSGPPAGTTARTAHLVFTVDDVAATLTCSFDGAAFAPCSSPVDLSGLADGPHDLRVRATDSFGNVGTASRAWVVDNTAPTVTITAGPSGTVTTDDVSFSFEADDDPVMFECRLDAATFALCPGQSKAFPDLSVGAHRFEVRATNAAGLTSAVVVRDFTVAVAGDPDLRLSVSPTSLTGVVLTTTGLGDDFVLSATTRNVGDAASDATVLTVPMPVDLRLVGALPNGCAFSASQRLVTCAVGSVPAGEARTFDLRVEAVFSCTVYGDSSTQTGAAGRLLGSTGDDVICGGGGGDEILGRGGNDIVWGYGPTGLVSTSASVAYGPGARSATALPAAVTIGGVDGADTITTAQGTDLVRSQAGDDRVTTGAGSDTVEADSGDDRVDTGTGDSIVTGGPGIDVITGGPDRDTVGGGDDADTITSYDGGDAVSGDGGNDTINAGTGANVVNGGTGIDRISGTTGLVNGDDGDDNVRGTTGTVNGGSGIDTISGTTGSVNGNDDGDLISTTTGPVNGGGGNDDISGTRGAVEGGEGDDTIRGTTGTVNGGAGTDTISGTTGPVNGGTGDDRITGSSGLVNGNDGDDTIIGTAGADVIHGNAGRDTITASGGDDVVTGDEDGDIINAGAGNNTVSGGTGDDQVTGSTGLVNGDDGDDTIIGTVGADVIHGNAGRDTITASGGDDVVTGDEDGDTINAGAGNNTVSGGTGDDNISGSAGVINGDDGGDTITGNSGAVWGGDGDDQVSGNSGIVNGEGGADRITGTGAANTINGGSGDDIVSAGGGADAVDGGDGTDTLRGEAGIDTIHGSFGGDRIEGGDGADLLFGDTGDDTMLGDAGNDVVNGDNGADHLFGGLGDDRMSGGILGDRMHGDAGNDVLDGDDGPDDVNGDADDDDVRGGDGEDTIRGENGDDLMGGGQGEDTLFGGAGHDYMSGNDNHDEMNGGLGRDVLRGGDGPDDLDGGGTDATKQSSPRDHWNRLYGDEGDADICHYGPGLGVQMTNYRDPSCELQDDTFGNIGQGWLNGSAVRLDRVRSDGDYPG